ncbi:MAG: hypothetical protein DDT19_00044 [Syntrophomonadaceae bacterium]|nr:hypothetical protein [Bacillota bacterium]
MAYLQDTKELFLMMRNLAQLQEPVLGQFAVRFRFTGWGQILKLGPFAGTPNLLNSSEAYSLNSRFIIFSETVPI